MKALITGATGFLGRRLAARFEKPVVLSRNPERAGTMLPEARTFAWNPEGEQAPAAAFRGVEVIFNLLGEPVSGRWTRVKKERIRESRILGTRHLVDTLLILEDPPSVLVSVSAVGYYGSRDEEKLTEETAPASDFLAKICTDWEVEARRATDAGIRVVSPRIGLVLGQGGALLKLLPLFRAGLGGPLGSGRQFWPWVHTDDVVEILLHVAWTNRLSGPVNATAPGPVTNRDFTRELARVLHRPAFLPIPAPLLRLALGEFATALLASQRVVPEKLLQTGYEFRFTDLEKALKEVVGGSRRKWQAGL